MIYAVLATTYNGIIGSNNRLPWHYPVDLNYYNNLTKNKKVLMGLNTYLSLVNTYKIKNFLYEKIYVVSEKKVELNNNLCEIVTDLNKFLLNFSKEDELYVVGGKMVYEQTANYIERYFITYILQNHEGNIKLNLNLQNFNLVNYVNNYPLLFTIYQRIK